MGLDLGDAGLGVGADNLAATGGEVADDVAHAVVRNGDGEQDNGLEKDGLQLLHGVLEGQGAGHLEGHFRGIDGVEAAVVELHLEVHDRIAGDVAAGRGLLNALVDGRDVLARDGSAHDGVLEGIAGAARGAFHLDPAVAELAAAAGLLLVASLHLHLALDGFAVGHLRSLQVDVDLEAALGALDGKLDVELAHAGEQDVARLLVVLQLEGDVVVEQLGHGCEDLVFLALGLGRDGEGDELGREIRDGEGEVLPAVAERVAGAGAFQLGDGNDGAGTDGVLAGRDRLAGEVEQAAHALRFARAGVGQGHVAGERAGEHAQERVELAGDGVGNALEDKGSQRRIGRNLVLAAVDVDDSGTLQRGGEELLDGIQQACAALVLQRGAAEHGEDGAGHDALAHAEGEIVVGEGAFLEILLEQGLVAFSDVLDGHVVDEVHFLGHGVGNAALGHAALAVEGVGFLAEDVDVARELAAFHDGVLEADGLDADVGEAVVGHLEVGAVAVELVDHDERREVVLADVVPEALGEGTHAVNGIDDKEHAVHALEQILDVAGEVAVAGDVEKEMTLLVPEEGGCAGLDGSAAADFFRLVVEAGRSLFNGAHSVDDAGVEEQHFRKRRFTAATRADDGIRALHIERVWHGILHFDDVHSLNGERAPAGSAFSIPTATLYARPGKGKSWKSRPCGTDLHEAGAVLRKMPRGPAHAGSGFDELGNDAHGYLLRRLGADGKADGRRHAGESLVAYPLFLQLGENSRRLALRANHADVAGPGAQRLLERLPVVQMAAGHDGDEGALVYGKALEAVPVVLADADDRSFGEARLAGELLAVVDDADREAGKAGKPRRCQGHVPAAHQNEAGGAAPGRKDELETLRVLHHARGGQPVPGNFCADDVAQLDGQRPFGRGQLAEPALACGLHRHHGEHGVAHGVGDAQALEEHRGRLVGYEGLDEEAHAASADHVRNGRILVGQVEVHKLGDPALDDPPARLDGLVLHGAPANGAGQQAVRADEHGCAGVPRRGGALLHHAHERRVATVLQRFADAVDKAHVDSFSAARIRPCRTGPALSGFPDRPRRHSPAGCP